MDRWRAEKNFSDFLDCAGRPQTVYGCQRALSQLIYVWCQENGEGLSTRFIGWVDSSDQMSRLDWSFESTQLFGGLLACKIFSWVWSRYSCSTEEKYFPRRGINVPPRSRKNSSLLKLRAAERCLSVCRSNLYMWLFRRPTGIRQQSNHADRGSHPYRRRNSIPTRQGIVFLLDRDSIAL